MFRYWSGTWRINKSKRNTSRAVFSKDYNFPHCFTVETSNCGYFTPSNRENIEFTTNHWLLIGQYFCECLSDLVDMTI